MTREDLFAAIGEVEESRLARSELTAHSSSGDTPLEESDMKKQKGRPGRVIRNLLIAAVLVSMLVVTAFAATGYLIFGSPTEMLTAIFGDETGYDHSEGSITPDPQNPESGILVEPTYDRVPVDESIVQEELAPLVSPVGQSISWNGYTLTIDANMYDAATKCGFVTYTLENPNGLGYSVQSDGEVIFPSGEILVSNQYGRSYIIQDKSSDTRLTATYYYQLRNPDSSDLEIGFTQWASITQDEINQKIADIKQQLRQEISEEEAFEFQKAYYGSSWAWFEANRTKEEIIDAGYEVMAHDRLEEVVTCPDKITIPENTQGEVDSITLGNGAVILSSFAVTIKKMEVENIDDSSLDLMKIGFADGTEYIVQEDYIQNYVFYVGNPENEEYTYMFNRIIDVEEVVFVIVDGNVELNVD